MDYRVATVDDAPLLADLNRQLIQDEAHRNPMTLDELEARMRGWLASGEYAAILFAEESAAVAYALYRDDGDSIYLRQFFVSRDHRRRGIGRAAMALLLQDVLPRGKRVRLDVLVGNQRAHQFWRSVGFADYAITMEHVSDSE